MKRTFEQSAGYGKTPEPTPTKTAFVSRPAPAPSPSGDMPRASFKSPQQVPVKQEPAEKRTSFKGPARSFEQASRKQEAEARRDFKAVTQSTADRPRPMMPKLDRDRDR